MRQKAPTDVGHYQSYVVASEINAKELSEGAYKL
jgi:hypothetical protein